MQKIIYEDEVYYYANNKFLDSSFAEVPLNIALKLAEQVFYNQDFTTLNENQLLEFIKSTREAGLYNLSRQACEYGLDEYYEDIFFVKNVLPICTSNCRELHYPKKAIEIFNYFKSDEFQSVALLTSVAAAYADLKDYESALKYANMAYAKQGGGTGETNELSLVYKRIKSESGE